MMCTQLAIYIFALATSSTPSNSSNGLDLEIIRYVLENGLVVLMHPDPTRPGVLVDVTSRAGTMYEPPERAGFAHLVEHVLVRGESSRLNYVSILEAQGATVVNAFTTPNQITFRTVAPASALPAALWVAADRMGELPRHLDGIDLQRHLRVVRVEEALRRDDIAYGPTEKALSTCIFPAPHAMRAGVLGSEDELSGATMSEVRAFVEAHFVPPNTVLTLVGAFETEVARSWIERTLGRLPRKGMRIEPPDRRAESHSKPSIFKVKEARSRRPRVSLAWRLDELDRKQVAVLELGALMLTASTDGAFGTRIHAELDRYGQSYVFRMDLVLPYDKPMLSAQSEAQAFLRYLTLRALPADEYDIARRSLDRALMFSLDTLEGISALATSMELEGRALDDIASINMFHWKVDRHALQQLARRTLQGNPIIVHARPTNPFKPKLEWDVRDP